MSGRGYGHQHRVLRAQLQLVVDAGEAKCWRCGEEVPTGTEWHLGHDDDDRTIYRGIEHPECNLSAAGVKARTRDRLRRERRPRRAMRPRQRDCLICGSAFKASYPDQRTCSRACGWELRRREAPVREAKVKPLRTCPVCTAQHQRTTYCSPECCAYANSHRGRAERGLYKSKAVAPRVVPTVTVDCEECGQPFSYLHYGSSRQRCDGCRDDRERARKRDVKARARLYTPRGGSIVV